MTDLPSFMVIKGQQHKLCSGPGHSQPTWLPATEKYFHVRKSKGREGKLVSYCRLCTNWNKLKSPGLSGWVPNHLVRQYYLESIHRVGLMEAARRAGMNYNHYRAVADGKTRWVQKRKLRVVMLELISMRRKNEVRHRDDIRHGAGLRGKPLKPVTRRRDLNKPNGDVHVGHKRASRERRSRTTTSDLA